eukprot:g3355.t1
MAALRCVSRKAAPTVMLGVLGGMGPDAGIMFQQKIHEAHLKTERSDGTDQSFPSVLLHTTPAYIGDRTQYLVSSDEDEHNNPGIAAAHLLMDMARVASNRGQLFLGVTPCNSFCAPPIWDAFKAELEALSNSSSGDDDDNSNDEAEEEPPLVLNLVEETVERIKASLGSGANIGLLSTTGTKELGTYCKPLRAAGFNMVYCEDQTHAHNVIYDKENGLKSGRVTEWARNECNALVDELRRKGADTIVLGCTEFPLALSGDGFLDPMNISAELMVRVMNSYPQSRSALASCIDEIRASVLDPSSS